jgi:hypothetical protein
MKPHLIEIARVIRNLSSLSLKLLSLKVETVEDFAAVRKDLNKEIQALQDLEHELRIRQYRREVARES